MKCACSCLTLQTPVEYAEFLPQFDEEPTPLTAEEKNAFLKTLKGALLSTYESAMCEAHTSLFYYVFGKHVANEMSTLTCTLMPRSDIHIINALLMYFHTPPSHMAACLPSSVTCIRRALTPCDYTRFTTLRRAQVCPSPLTRSSRFATRWTTPQSSVLVSSRSRVAQSRMEK